jgi:hypothetical protein
LKRWRAFARSGKKSKLAVDRAAARRGKGLLDRANEGEIRIYCLALLAKQPQLTAHHVRALVADAFPHIHVGGATAAVPPVRTFQHALKGWRKQHRVELESIRNPDGFKSTMRFAARVANPASRLNEVWQIDASPADVLTLDGRYTIYVCVDIFSRRMIALVTKTPRAAAVGLLIRKAILAWGVPERIKTDNGSDFIARATQRLFAALAIEHEKSAPFRPEQKGHVERAIGTLQRGLMRTLEGFIGHSVADRKVIEGRKAFSQRLGETAEDMFEVRLTAAELQQRADEWCADVYGNAPHAGLKGQTPFAVAAMSATRVRRIEDVRALDMLLAPVAGKDGLRVVTKTGLRINDTHYIAGWLPVGETVLVRMDEADMGRAYVFDETGEQYLGDAIAPDLAGLDPAATIAAVRAEQKPSSGAGRRRQADRIPAPRRTAHDAGAGRGSTCRSRRCGDALRRDRSACRKAARRTGRACGQRHTAAQRRDRASPLEPCARDRGASRPQRVRGAGRADVARRLPRRPRVPRLRQHLWRRRSCVGVRRLGHLSQPKKGPT